MSSWSCTEINSGDTSNMQEGWQQQEGSQQQEGRQLFGKKQQDGHQHQ
jgi:hypothetical protein